MAKYKHVVPTAEFSGALGEVSSCSPVSRRASGPAVATMIAFRAKISAPSLVVSFVIVNPSSPTTSSRPTTSQFKTTLPDGNFFSNCSPTAPMPSTGKQFCPVASMRMTGCEKEKGQSRVSSMGVLYIAMYGQTVTSFGKTVRL
jgi:hypothetical protein